MKKPRIRRSSKARLLKNQTYSEDVLKIIQTMPEFYKNVTDFFKTLFLELVKTYTIKESYKIILNSTKSANFFPQFYKMMCSEYPLNVPENLTLVNYVKDNYRRCKYCGKFTEREFCNHSCVASYLHMTNFISEEKRKEINEKIREKNRNRTPEEKAEIIRKLKLTKSKQDQHAINEKQKQTKLERYGSKGYNNVNKWKATKLERYGSEGYNNVQQALTTKLEKYNGSYHSEEGLESIKENNRRVKELHYDVWLHKMYSCKVKNREITLEECEEILRNLNKEYCLKHFVENGLFNVYEFAKYFCITLPRAYPLRKILGIDLPTVGMFSGRSIEETKLFDWIPSENKICSDRTIIKPLELDIYLPDNNLAIEYDGIYWHCDLSKDADYHLNKTKQCLAKGIQLFHVFESDDIEIWKSMISNKLKLNKVIYARKCIVKELQYSEVKDFLESNHLQGSCNSKINLGMFYEDKLVEVMTFSKPRFNSNYDYELIRLCTLKYTNVVGGASKLFSYFKKHFEFKSIISYANLRFSNGLIYKTLGFNYLRNTDPNYLYTNGTEWLSRYKCQKHNLKDLLKKFDETLSEYDNMLNNGYLRVYDCGNMVFEYVK